MYEQCKFTVKERRPLQLVVLFTQWRLLIADVLEPWTAKCSEQEDKVFSVAYAVLPRYSMCNCVLNIGKHAIQSTLMECANTTGDLSLQFHVNQAIVAAWSKFNSEFQNMGHNQVYQLHDLPHVQWPSMKVRQVDVTGLTDADPEYNRLTMDLQDLVHTVEDNGEVWVASNEAIQEELRNMDDESGWFLDHSRWIVAGLGLGMIFIAILLFTNMGVTGQALKKVGGALPVQFIHLSFRHHFPRRHPDKEELMNRFTHVFKDVASVAVNSLVKPDEPQASTSTGSATTGV